MALDKINLILLYCSVRTGHFGAGSHIHSLLGYLKECKDIVITIIRTDDLEAKEVGFSVEEKWSIVSIPQPENKLFLTCEETPAQKIYAQRVADIMLPYVSDLQNMVVLANSIDYKNLCVVLKNTFEGAKILYVHHSWGWKTIWNVPDPVFADYWNNHREAIPVEALDSAQHQQQMAQLADSVITVTQQAKHFFCEILQIHNDKVSVIYNGIEMPPKHPNSKTELRELYGFPTDRKILLYAGRVRADKGAGILLEAFALLCKERRDAHLVLAGDGDIQKLIPSASPHWARVTITGQIERAMLQDLYQLADIGIMPSLHEQCSYTAIEMTMSGLPIIVSAVDGLNEMFEDKVTTLKVPFELDINGIKKLDADVMASKMFQLLNDSDLQKVLSKNAYEHACTLFLAERMGKQYYSTIKKIVKNIQK